MDVAPLSREQWGAGLPADGWGGASSCFLFTCSFDSGQGHLKMARSLLVTVSRGAEGGQGPANPTFTRGYTGAEHGATRGGRQEAGGLQAQADTMLLSLCPQVWRFHHLPERETLA